MTDDAGMAGAAQRVVGAERRRRDWARDEIAKAGLWYDAVTEVTPEGDAILERFPGEPIPVFTRFEPAVGDLVLGGWVGRPEDGQPVVFGALPDDGARFAVRDADGRPVLTADPVARTVTLGGPVVGGGLSDAASTSTSTSTTSTTVLLGCLTLAMKPIPAGEVHDVLIDATLTYNSTHGSTVLGVNLDGVLVMATSQVYVANTNQALRVAGVVANIGAGDHLLQVAYRGGGTAGTTVQRTAVIRYDTKRVA